MTSRQILLSGALASLLLGALAAHASTTQKTIAVGPSHACAITQWGRLKCWGDNDFGQLGDASTTASASPVDVVGLDRTVLAVSVSYRHSCAIVAGGEIFCWGSNANGELGDGTATSRLRPTQVAGLSGMKVVATGYKHTCALSQQGAAMCWGANESGQLGDGTFVNRLQPVPVSGLPSGLSDVEASERNSCALTADGTITCWGYEGIVVDWSNCWTSGWPPFEFCASWPSFRTAARMDQPLAHGFASMDMPVSGSGGTVTWSRLCGLTPAGEIRCSVNEPFGSTQLTPGFAGGTALISMGGGHTCIADREGAVACFGYNTNGELGTSTDPDNWSNTPRAVPGVPKGVVEIATGATSTCARTATGDIYCWGDNRYGQLGDGTTATTLGKIVKVAGVSASFLNYTGLWWNPGESGWGINLNHQGDILFGTLLTYDASGAPSWFVMSSGNRVSGTTYSGALYRTTGPAFNADPFTPIGASNVTQVGTMTVAFASADRATLEYTVNGAAVHKSIETQVFGTRAARCVPATADRASLANYQDLWWNPAESGWGLNITHQDDTLFATLFTYDARGKDMWLVMPAGRRQVDGSYLGDLYSTRGPAFDANPARPIGAADITRVGTMGLRFADGNTGTLTYAYDGARVTKPITRQVFSHPPPACG